MKNNIDPKILIRIALVLLLIVALGSLFALRGFRFTSYNPSYIINVSGELKDTLINELQSKQNVARIDRQQGRVYFQYTSESEVNGTVTELKTRHQDQQDKFQINWYFEEQGSIFGRSGNNLTFALAILIGIYLFNRYFFRRMASSDRLKLILVLAINIIVTAVIGLGMISLLSNIAAVSEYYVFSLAITLTLTTIVYLFGLHRYLADNQVGRIDGALYALTKQIYDLQIGYLPLIVITALLLTVALGGRYFVEATIMILTWMIALITTREFSWLSYELLQGDFLQFSYRSKNPTTQGSNKKSKHSKK